MKKLLCLLLVCALCAFALTGCKKQSAVPDETAEGDGLPTASEVATEVTPVPDVWRKI